jgi:hypothetical protein
MAERRRQPRAAFTAWVELSIGSARRRAEASDLSIGGLGLSLLSGRLAPDTRIVSEFPLPGIGLPLELDGEVAWFDPAGARGGLRFVDLDPGLEELLASFVAGRLGG